MTRFLGAFEYHLDDRNRVQLPPKIREAFSVGGLLVKGGEECIEVYTHDGFEVLTDVVDKAPRLSSGSESLNRAVFSTAREIPRDRQGRISIPQELLQHIGLVNDEVKKTETRQSGVIAGVGWRLEIWAKDTWQQKEEGLPQDRIEALERLALGESSKAE